MISVFAEIQVKPGRRQAVLDSFAQLLPDVLAEKGCSAYVPLVDVPTQLAWQHKAPHSIFMWEQWASVQHLEQHLAMPHMKQHQERVKDDVLNVVINIIDHALPAKA
ncbi:putative quinol monooxygenase [Yersinia nurmii]|uniref:Quinol monooxygenase n=1 Tax=Yersinia nurmii TaxID=685706 RepID=A0AAW7JUW9_9GAMM|nr:putative quinol monooxygenase [Yersinia nurmii]MDN0086241.1 putative quinol monooxygenase [Yersinia nurmii]CNE47403.1 ygin protei involved in menadione metabolism [Yersinia nurmii]